MALISKTFRRSSGGKNVDEKKGHRNCMLISKKDVSQKITPHINKETETPKEGVRVMVFGCTDNQTPGFDLSLDEFNDDVFVVIIGRDENENNWGEFVQPKRLQEKDE
ncbi:hypothetical protein PIB30_002281 [Stylosanthes scabra]|uniref:Uncharacterized protein n=1 Tax=Stylosanthes scabra TaxID=79078 RepID=A0ABU6U2R3_9FABA|nr:hypothetical protein [Stylosanthes scabra]